VLTLEGGQGKHRVSEASRFGSAVGLRRAAAHPQPRLQQPGQRRQEMPTIASPATVNSCSRPPHSAIARDLGKARRQGCGTIIGPNCGLLASSRVAA
jgi:hypothetical protein